MHYLGIDIGGTNIKAGVVDATGTVGETLRAQTPAADLDGLVTAVADLAERLRARTPVAGIGVGVAGLHSTRTGVMETSPNVPCLRHVHFEAMLAARLGAPVVADNDANVAAYAEWACGAGRGLRHVAYISLGTGLGCGLVLSGKLFHGASGYAGEFGHNVIEPGGRRCACGGVGCLETRASATAMVWTARELLQSYPESRLGAVDELSAEHIFEAAVAGDEMALRVFDETGRYLGAACANLINLLNLEMIVLGGGVMASGDMLLQGVSKAARRLAFPSAAQDCAIVQSSLWPDAGLIGAAMVARDRLPSREPGIERTG